MLGEDPADRLHAAEAALVLVDERYERVCGRSSSAAKKDPRGFQNLVRALQLGDLLLHPLICADSSVVVPGRAAASIWFCRTHLRSVPVVPMPSFDATAFLADHSVSYSGRTSATKRTARLQNPAPAPPGQRMPHRHRPAPHPTDPTLKSSVGVVTPR